MARDEGEKLGYILAKLEELLSRQDSIEGRLETLEDTFKGAYTVYKTMKFVLAILIAVLTFRLGNVAELWNIFRNG